MNEQQRQRLLHNSHVRKTKRPYNQQHQKAEDVLIAGTCSSLPCTLPQDTIITITDHQPTIPILELSTKITTTYDHLLLAKKGSLGVAAIVTCSIHTPIFFPLSLREKDPKRTLNSPDEL